MNRIAPSPAGSPEAARIWFEDGSSASAVIELANSADEAPKLRIYCPRCSKRFYTRAGRGETATCYHCQAEVRSTGARSQDPAGWRNAYRAGARSA